MRLKLSRKLFLFSVLSLSSFIVLKAQVTIGSDIPPNEGSLLDLKQYVSSDGNVNSNKGLGLSRIALTDLNSLVDINKGSTTRPDPEEHAGLIVYNITESDNICPGVHLWTGAVWNRLGEKGVELMTDVRTLPDGNIESITYPIRTFGEGGTWMLRNLRATTYADNLGINKSTGDLVKHNQSDESPTHKSYYYPNMDQTILDEDKHPEFGFLYTWAAATNGKGGLTGTGNAIEEGESLTYPDGIANTGAVEQIGVQGVCPDGWHLPSDKEWNGLERAIANEQTGLYTIGGYKSNVWNSDGVDWALTTDARNNTGNGHGTSMRNSFTKIDAYSANGKSKSICNGGGFNILLVGVIGKGSVVVYGRTATFWSSSSDKNSNSAWGRSFSNMTVGVSRGNYVRDYMYSVRCKRNI